ncbi:MAG: hypothetical protein OXG82_19225 [Gammaproteobacteria bacterium]|nr:hypothetical protein [Gammaproteobacteria bacterium]
MGLTKDEAKALILDDVGILSNWWRNKVRISPQEVAEVLTEANLDRHLHDYARFGDETPFISLACGAVERDAVVRYNWVRSAIDTALMFATDSWTRPGALFYVWVATSHRPAVALQAVAEPVRDLNIYWRWSPHQPEGEVTAKVHIPANQIEKLEWWMPTSSGGRVEETIPNPCYVSAEQLSDVRALF